MKLLPSVQTHAEDRGAEKVSASVAVQLLLAEALNNGGHDNCSVILVKVARLGNAHEPQDWELQEEMMIQEQNIALVI